MLSGVPASALSVRIVSAETGDVSGIGEEGIIEVSGPHLMKGYLGRDDLTGEAIKDGWYSTGDLGYRDKSGYLFITGRQSRFSKIGGEMVPHELIESELTRAASTNQTQQLAAFAVTSVPDEKRGERVVVLHTGTSDSVSLWRSLLSEVGLPNLFIPRIDDFLEVEAIPLLGSGKHNLGMIRDIAPSATACL